MSPGLGVTQSLGGIRKVHGEYILTETWDCPFSIHHQKWHPQ